MGVGEDLLNTIKEEDGCGGDGASMRGPDEPMVSRS